MLYREIIAVCSGTVVSDQTKAKNKQGSMQTNKQLHTAQSFTNYHSSNFPLFVQPPQFITTVTTAHRLSALTKMNPFQALPTDYIRSHLILLSTLSSSKQSLSLCLLHYNSTLLRFPIRTTYSANPNLLDPVSQLGNIWWAVQIIKFLIM